MALFTLTLNILSLMEKVRRVWMNCITTKLNAANAKMDIMTILNQRFMACLLHCNHFL